MTELDPQLDPHTPVLIGVGQFAERLDSPGYAALSPVELAAAAARAALEDTGVPADVVAGALDVVAGVRQFEASTPMSVAPLGASDNVPRSIAKHVGADPARAVLDIAGGQSPQRLVTEFCAAIAAGSAQAVLIAGAEAISTVAALAAQDDQPDFTEHVEGSLEDRGFGLKGLLTRDALMHDLGGAPTAYSLFDNARRARLGMNRADYRDAMGRLFAPFTEVAAANPFASAPVARSAEELMTPSEQNREITEPYPRYVVAREKVNQAAAVVLTSVATARHLGVPEEKFVYLAGHADLREPPLFDRPDLSAAPASALAFRHALEVAGIGIDDVATFDLYSCFPIAVSAICDHIGLDPDDPRGLTLTGGLPFFGGPGNNYSMHGIAETVVRARANPGSYGLVGANGGVLSKYSVGVYTTTPGSWRPDRSAELQAEADRWPTAAHVSEADGPATIETYTVEYTNRGRRGIVVGRLDDGGARFVALSYPGDDELLDALLEDEVVGRRVHVKFVGLGNRVALTRERLEELDPTPPLVLRESYEFVQVHRDGHLLEVTINRPESRNALTPEANAELEHVFDCFFADPQLWVAILTGAGGQAFSAGNDLKYRKPIWVPRTGFGGLTARADVTKPVIAAVNGFAFGGGFEIALACHLIVADETAQFGLTEVRVGLVAGAGGLIRLPRVVPPAIANELILTGRRLTAEEARALGIVNRVVPAGTAVDAARELAQEILQGSPTSVRLSLQIMADTRGIADTSEALRAQGPAIDELLFTFDASEGSRAFAEKRAPVWRNR